MKLLYLGPCFRLRCPPTDSQQRGPLLPPPPTPVPRWSCCSHRVHTSIPPSSCFGSNLVPQAPSPSISVPLPSQPHAGFRYYPSPQQPRIGVSPSMLRHSLEDAFGPSCLLSSSGTDSSSWNREVNTQKQHPKLSQAKSALHLQSQP